MAVAAGEAATAAAQPGEGRARLPARLSRAVAAIDDALTAPVVRPGGPSGFLKRVEQRAQIRAGLIRIGLALVLAVSILIAAANLPADDTLTWHQILGAEAFLALFGLFGLVVFALARRGIGLNVLPYVTALVDAVLILGELTFNQVTAGVPGNMTFVFPVVWIVPIALAANAIYFRPALQAFTTGAYVIGIAAIAGWAGYVPIGERIEALHHLDLALGFSPNNIRLLMILGTGLTLIIAAWQGRRLLERAVQETELRMNLTRYLPRELAPVLTDDAFAELRAGERLTASLLFVDIRNSTSLGGAMDPAALARFITAFRRRVGRAAAEHGGVIDKFIGDGALILFGVPRPAEDDARRALACAHTLVRLVGRWNEKRGFDPPVEIGIGLHCGEVFCGVLGEEARLEFTVLGDPVNVASRLEGATKTLGGPILASADIVEASGAPDEAWREATREPLPGVGRSIVVLVPSDQPGARVRGEVRPAA